MHATEMFFELAKQVYFGLAAFWPLTVCLIAAALWTFVAAKPTPGAGRWRLFWLGCAPPFVIPFLILVCGTAFAHAPQPGAWVEPLSYPLYIISALFFTHIPLTAFLVWRWPEQQAAVVASAALAGYVSFGSWMISWMAVTGDWL